MSPQATLLTTIGAGIVAVAAGYAVVTDIFLRERRRIAERFRDRFGPQDQKPDSRSPLFKDLDLLQSEELREPNWRDRLDVFIEQSGLAITVRQLAGFSGAAAAIFGIAAVCLTGLWSIACVVAPIGGFLPLLYLRHCRTRRIQTLCRQLPDAFELMSRAVRSGQTMPSAMQMVAANLKQPVAGEFARCCEQEHLGLPRDTVLRDLARRTGVMELQMFVVTMLVQRQAGGDPVSTLNNLAGIIRNRVRLAGKVKAVTGEGRMQATVLSVLPFAAFGLMYVLNRSYAQALLDRPGLLAGIACSIAIGSFWIRRIVQFDV